jgi:transposase
MLKRFTDHHLVVAYLNSDSLPTADQPMPEAEELKRLRKEVKQLQLENEILKKAAAYFARDSL